MEFFSIPSYSLICKRSASVKNALPKLSRCRPSIVLLDASGVKVVGEGKWKVKIHGRQRQRKWLKVHIAVDIDAANGCFQNDSGSSMCDSSLFFVISGGITFILSLITTIGACSK